MNIQYQFQGKTAVITGGAQGIGFEIARGLPQAGARVTIADLNPDTGHAAAATLFLVASGLSIIFGVTRIVNFAHGSFYMLGAYATYYCLKLLGLGYVSSLLLATVLVAAAAVGLSGFVVERFLLRHIYKVEELYQLLFTYALVLVFGGAAKFIKDYAAAGLKGKIPLYGSGFLTEGVLDAAGPAADGIYSTLHYSDSLDTARNKAFRLAYAKTFKLQPDVYAVQGYDTGLLMIQGANAVKGDLSNKKVVVVKSSQHFHASYSKVASLIVYAAAPGAVTLDLRTLPYRKIRRPKWPIDGHLMPIDA